MKAEEHLDKIEGWLGLNHRRTQDRRQGRAL